MTSYSTFGAADNLFSALPDQPLSQTLLLWSSSEFVIVNRDGSQTRFSGTGLVWDSSQGRLTAGTILAANHMAGSRLIDLLADFSVTATDLQAALEDPIDASDGLHDLMFAGDDVIDSRDRRYSRDFPSFLNPDDGDDLVMGGTGRDEVYAASGRDTVEGNGGNDYINGGLDDDLLSGNDGVDRLIGDGGADTLDGGAQKDILYGGAGDDVYQGGLEIDTVVYTRSIGDLIFTSTTTGPCIIEPNGRDTLIDIERIATDEGIFAWDATALAWTKITGKPGALILNPGTAVVGSPGSDTIALASGDKNIVIARAGNDSIEGKGSFDLLIGGRGDDSAAGGLGGDRLYGDGGNDTLAGGDGGDLLYGGVGRDLLSGGNGNDTLTGGLDADVFVFQSGDFGGAFEQWGADIVNDFQVGVDAIRLDFGPEDHGALSLDPIWSGLLISLEGAGSILLKDVATPGLTLDDLLL